jgi:hypothetical protein
VEIKLGELNEKWHFWLAEASNRISTDIEECETYKQRIGDGFTFEGQARGVTEVGRPRAPHRTRISKFKPKADEKSKRLRVRSRRP